MSVPPCADCAALGVSGIDCLEWHKELGDLVEEYPYFESEQDTEPDKGLCDSTDDE